MVDPCGRWLVSHGSGASSGRTNRWSRLPSVRLTVEELMTTIDTTQAQAPQLLSSDQALKIAQADAQKAYRDLTRYRITLVLEADGWHIDYDLTKPGVAGGGPHYLVDALTGAIISKRYEQ